MSTAFKALPIISNSIISMIKGNLDHSKIKKTIWVTSFRLVPHLSNEQNHLKVNYLPYNDVHFEKELKKDFFDTL